MSEGTWGELTEIRETGQGQTPEEFGSENSWPTSCWTILSRNFAVKGRSFPRVGHRLVGVLSGKKNIWRTIEDAEQLP